VTAEPLRQIISREGREEAKMREDVMPSGMCNPIDVKAGIAVPAIHGFADICPSRPFASSRPSREMKNKTDGDCGRN
jgi:hypothetical protein